VDDSVSAHGHDSADPVAGGALGDLRGLTASGGADEPVRSTRRGEGALEPRRERFRPAAVRRGVQDDEIFPRHPCHPAPPDAFPPPGMPGSVISRTFRTSSSCSSERRPRRFTTSRTDSKFFALSFATAEASS
jgi:hypothetical protein